MKSMPCLSRFVLVLIGVAFATACQPHDTSQPMGTSLKEEKPASDTISNELAKEQVLKHKGHAYVLPNDKTRGRSASFDKKAVIKLMNLDKVYGIKIYYGLSKNKDANIIMVPVDSSGKDLISARKKYQPFAGPYYMLFSTMRCPHDCENNSL